MAQISVSELMSDPDFVDEIQVLTRVPTVNLYGQNSVNETVVNTIGSVQPADGKVLARLPEALREMNVSSFFFKGQIVATAPGQYSSILVFKGVRYQVKSVNDFSNWGQGYTEGVCIQESPAL